MTRGHSASRRRKRRRHFKPRFFIILFILIAIILAIAIKVLSGDGKATTAPSSSSSEKETTYSNANTKTQETTSESESTETSSQPSEMEVVPKEELENFTALDAGHLVGYFKTKQDASLFDGVDESQKVILEVPKDSYVESFGQVGDYTLIKYDHKPGYIKMEALGTLEDATLFKVEKGVLFVNKEYSLPEDYRPEDHPEARAHFNEMKDAIQKELGKAISVASGFRTYDYQNDLYEGYVDRLGEDYTEISSAQPGHSEHQTGLAYDIRGEDDNAVINKEFDATPEAQWLAKNAHKYGFILRYPKEKEQITQYMYESWHYRYVGVRVATEMAEDGKCLEEYLGME